MKDWYLALVLIVIIIAIGFTSYIAKVSQVNEPKEIIVSENEGEIREPLVAPSPQEKIVNLTRKTIQNTSGLNKSDVESNPNTRYIEIKNMEFVPKEVTIQTGTTVIWTNNDWTGFYGRVHMIASSSSIFRSSRIPYNSSFNHTFNDVGTFKYLDPIYRSQASGGILVPPGTIYVE